MVAFDKLGWLLAPVALGVGYWQYGWPGLVLALTVIVFWLLLQFSRAMRAMRLAGSAPVGRIGSAVMLQSRLREGMRLLELIQITRSLGQKLSDEPERFRWQDDSGASVEVELVNGRISRWTLSRETLEQVRADASADASADTRAS